MDSIPIHKRFKPIKAHIDNVEAFTPEEFKRLIGAIDESIPKSTLCNIN